MKKKIKLLVLVAIIVTGTFYWYRNKPSSNELSYLSELVVRSDIKKTVSAVGTLSPAQLVNVGAQVTGQIKSFHVNLGQQINQGDLIAEIDAITQKNTLASVEAQLASQIAQLKSKEFALEIAKNTYQREKKLWQRDATSKRELDTAKENMLSVEASVKDLQANIKQSKIRLDTEKINLGYTRITAPITGTVVSSSVEAGQTLNASQSSPTLVQIADLKTMLIKLQIAEADATQVKAGMPVSFSTLENSGKKLQSTLLSIDPGLTNLSQGNYNSTSDVTNNAIYYYGRAKVDNSDGQLRVGMTVLATIVIEQVQQVLAVPSQAIQNNEKGTFVRILTDSEGQQIVTERPVTIGLSNGTQTEIKKGLRQGERVVIASMSSQEIQQQTDNSIQEMEEL